MKKSKLLSMLLVIAMVVTMIAGVALAGEITIQNATIGKDYAAYKVFDVAPGTNPGEYVYTVTDKWEGIIGATDSPFVVNNKVATLKETLNGKKVTDETVIDFFENVTLPDDDMATDQGGATANTINWTVDPGYYYVTSSLGSAITLFTDSDSITIIDKNQSPSWEPENPEDFDPEDPDGADNETPLGKFVKNSDGKWVKYNDSYIDGENEFMINLYAPKFSGDKEIVSYTITDTFGEAFTVDSSTIKVTIDKAVKEGVYVKVGATSFEVLINVDKADYTTGNVSITYKATLNDEAAAANMNTADVTWSQVKYDPENPYDTSETPDDPETPDGFDPENPVVPGDPGTPYDPTEPTPTTPDTPADPRDPETPSSDVPTSETTTYTYEFELNKIDRDSKETIDNATFNLLDGETPITFVKDANGNYVVSKDASAKADIVAGKVKIIGLDAKTYTLEETNAPENYVKGADKEIKIPSIAKNEPNNGKEISVSVENAKKGAKLPSTGGIGTTIFYVVGGILVVGAVVLFITKKRMDANR